MSVINVISALSKYIVYFDILTVSCYFIFHTFCNFEQADVELAKKLLKTYFTLLKQEFGEDAATTKNHSLIHMADEVLKMNAPLGSYCAYAFENLNFTLKKVRNVTLCFHSKIYFHKRRPLTLC